MAATADTTAIPIIDVAPLFTTDADPAVVRQCIDDITHVRIEPNTLLSLARSLT